MNSELDIDSVLLDALENAADAIVIYDKAGNVLSCNLQFRTLYGYPDDLISPKTTVRDLIRFDLKHNNIIEEKARVRATLILNSDTLLMDLPRRDYVLKLGNGRHVSIYEHKSAKGSIVSIQRDITDLILKEEEARRSTELFKAAFDANSNVCSLTVFDTGTFLDVNLGWSKVLGYSREEAIGKTAIELGIWPSVEIRNELIKAISENVQLRDYLTTIKTRNGEIRRVLLNSEVLEVAGTKALYLSGPDVTDDLQTEIALQQSQQRFADFNKASSDWYWETDKLLRYTYISSKVENALGVAASEYIGCTIDEITGQGARNQAALRKIFDLMGEKKAFKDIVVYRFQRPDGHRKWVRVSGLPYYNQEGEFEGYRGSTADVTEQVELEEKIEKTRRMEAVGQLSGGIAHDFNNLLAVIQGNTEIVLDAVEKNHPELINHLQAVMRASDRGAELTQSMLAFSRTQRLSPSVFRLDGFVEQIMDVIVESMGPAISIRTDFDSDLWLCNADASKLESAFLNLCMNSRDAMQDGGTLTIEIRNKEVDETYALMERGVKPGKYVSLIVSDTGVGISPEKMPHIMEPFFTSKEVGKGTGLGLSMVYGFANQSKGSLSIYSEENIGTTVQLLLPIASETIDAVVEKVDH